MPSPQATRASPGARAGDPGASAPHDGGAALSDDLHFGGPGALLAALEGARTGRMRDIVATIQGEQDAIIRSELPGVLIVQGGPGTGKTAVALHRAAYLLYTHRFPLERQGVLVIGPNPLFLRYIEKVLPSLGESGVTLSTISGLVHGFGVRGDDPPEVARLKGDVRMARVVARAVRTRERPLRRTAEIPYGAAVLHLTPELTSEIVGSARRRPGTHNPRRRFVEQIVIRRLADEYQRTREGLGAGASRAAQAAAEAWNLRDSADVDADADNDADASADTADAADAADTADGPPRGAEIDIADFGRQIKRVPALSEALDRIWPRLSAEELLHDLFGAPPLLADAAKGLLDPDEQRLLYRRRSSSLPEVPFTAADAALVDEARVVLGPRFPRRSGATDAGGTTPHAPAGAEDDGPRTYGHIVVDEAQDLSPMQLRMVGRRSLSGSVTVVGDIGQATGPWAADRWDAVSSHLPAPAPRTHRRAVGQLPHAGRGDGGRLARARSGGAVAQAPHRGQAHGRGASVRGDQARGPCSRGGRQGRRAVRRAPARDRRGAVPGIARGGDRSCARRCRRAGDRDPRRHGLGAPVSLLPVDLANGLEFDGVVVVEPASVVDESPQGLRRLYVALTRPTRRLCGAPRQAAPCVAPFEELGAGTRLSRTQASS